MVQCGGSIPPSGTIGNIAKRIINKNSIMETTYYKTDFNSVIRATTKVAQEKIKRLIATEQVHLQPIEPKMARTMIKNGTEYIKIRDLI